MTEESQRLKRTLDAEDTAEPTPEISGEETVAGWGRKVLAGGITHVCERTVFR